MSYALGLIIQEIDKKATPLINEGKVIEAVVISETFAEDLKKLCDGRVPTAFVTHNFYPSIPVRITTQKETFTFELAHPNPKLPNLSEWRKGSDGQ